MQNFSPVALKLREEIEDNGCWYCKNAKFQMAPCGTKILLLIFASLERDNQLGPNVDTFSLKKRI